MANKKLGGAHLGDLVKDVVTGFKGVVICRAVWLNGCARLTVQPQVVKEGKPVESQCFDDLQLEVITRGVVASPNREPEPVVPVPAPAPVLRRTGGPQPNAQPRPTNRY